MRRGILFAVVAAFALGGTAQAQAPEKRVALVIGNATYKQEPLKNPVNDARAMAGRLKQLGFEVIARENVTQQQVGLAVAEFVRKIAPGGAALFYYAGHGMQVNGRNYLIPVDAVIDDEALVPFVGVDISQINEQMDRANARVKLTVLDACRNNPFERKLRGAGAPGRGLAPMDAARGSMIVYATAPGSVAADGDGPNGIYTGALLEALSVPDLSIEEVFKRTRATVIEMTRDAQTPWEHSSLIGSFVFNMTASIAAPGAADRELMFWQTIRDSKNPSDYEDYLTQFPKGQFASVAKRRIEESRKPQIAVAPTPATKPAKQQETVASPWVPITFSPRLAPGRNYDAELGRLADLAKRTWAELPTSLEQKDWLIQRVFHAEIHCQAGDRLGAAAALEEIKVNQVAQIQAATADSDSADAWHVLSFVADAYLRCGLYSELRAFERPAFELMQVEQGRLERYSMQKFNTTERFHFVNLMSHAATHLCSYVAGVMFMMGEFDRSVAFADASKLAYTQINTRIIVASLIILQIWHPSRRGFVSLPESLVPLRKNEPSRSDRDRALRWLREAAVLVEPHCERPEILKGSSNNICGDTAVEIAKGLASLGDEATANRVVRLRKVFDQVVAKTFGKDHGIRTFDQIDEKYFNMHLARAWARAGAAEKAKAAARTLLQKGADKDDVADIYALAGDMPSVRELVRKVDNEFQNEDKYNKKDHIRVSVAEALIERRDFLAAFGYAKEISVDVAAIGLLTGLASAIAKSGGHADLLDDVSIMLKDMAERVVQRGEDAFGTLARAASVMSEAKKHEVAKSIAKHLRSMVKSIKGMQDSEEQSLSPQQSFVRAIVSAATGGQSKSSGSDDYAEAVQVLELDAVLPIWSKIPKAEKRMIALAAMAQGIVAQKQAATAGRQ